MDRYFIEVSSNLHQVIAMNHLFSDLLIATDTFVIGSAAFMKNGLLLYEQIHHLRP